MKITITALYKYILTSVLICISIYFFMGILTNKTKPITDIVSLSGSQTVSTSDVLLYRKITKNNDSDKKVILMITKRLSLIQYAKNDLNIQVNNSEIAATIKKDKTFRIKNKFNNKKYRKILKENKITVFEYENAIKNNIIITKVKKATKIINGSKKTSLMYSNAMFKILNIDLYKINFTIQDEPKYKEKDLKKYYKENVDLFYKKDFFNVNIKRYKMSDKFIKSQFVIYKKNYKHIYDLKQVLIKTDKNLLKITKKINKSNFEFYAKKYSIDRQSGAIGGLMSGIIESELPPSFLTKIKASALNEVFVVKSNMGFHIMIKTKDIGEKISLKYFKTFFLRNLTKTFKESIVNSENDMFKNSNVVMSRRSLDDLFNNKKIKYKMYRISNFNDNFEKITVLSKVDNKKLNFKNKKDKSEITRIYVNQLKMKKAIRASLININSIKDKKWVNHTKIDVNRNTKIPTQIKDLIFSTKIGNSNGLVVFDTYYYFKVNTEKSFTIKEKEFARVLKMVYAKESESILKKEAYFKYAIKIIQ